MTAPTVHFVAALEHLPPTEAVRLAARADLQGFAGTVLIDRFQPWMPSQGQAAFVWVVAGAIGQQTAGAITVSAVPGFRSHPASVAQASATLAAMYPLRHRLLLSSGDAIDEHVVGRYWPEAPERASMLFEAADVVRKLFSASRKGNDTRHIGEHFRLEATRIWTMPESVPDIHLWAGGPVTARRAGRSGMGIVVQAGAPERMAAIIKAFREGQSEAHAPGGSAIVHAQLSWAMTDEAAAQQALRDWPMAGLRFPRGDIRSPFDVEQLARSVTVSDICRRVPVTADTDALRAHLQSFFDLGFDDLHVHNVGREQEAWIDVAGREILPNLVR